MISAWPDNRPVPKPKQRQAARLFHELSCSVQAVQAQKLSVDIDPGASRSKSAKLAASTSHTVQRLVVLLQVQQVRADPQK